MMKWILSDNVNCYGITVHEIKCPVCHHKETMHGDIKDILPSSCYVCGTACDGIMKGDLSL